MPKLNDVTFIKGQGGLGRPAAGKDYVSGMVFYTATLPSGFTSSARVKKILSVQDAASAGIDNTLADETRATGTYLVTAAGATGDTIELTVQEFSQSGNLTGLVSLGVYTRLSTDTTVSILATSISAFINTGTSTHGYSATVSTATVTITARAGLGIFLNSGSPLAAVIVGTIAGTITQFSGGVASLKATWYYHISEFFRINPTGELYLGMYAVPTTYDFTDLLLVQNFANGEIRQFAVYTDGTTYTSGKVQAAQTVAAQMETEHKPCSILLTFNYAAATLSALADLATLNSNKVSVVIGQDGFAQGYTLYKTVGKSITTLGAVLGLVSASKVSDSISWIARYNISNGVENDTAAFANGVNFNDQSTALITALNTSRYIFSIKQIGYAGTWVNDSHTCITFSSDYAFIENNRTIDKAERNVRAAYLPYLASPIVLQSDGTMSPETIANLEGVGETSLDQMVRDAELSFKQVTIATNQPVLQTSTITVAVDLGPVGVARNIVVPIKYVTSI